MKNHKQNGQVVLITLLVLSFAVTVALSLISRTSTDLSISNQIEDSAKAFSAAEAGVEQALKSGVTGVPIAGVLTASNVQYSTTVSDVGGAAGVYEFPQKTLAGATETLWLVNHTDTGAVDESILYPGNTFSVCFSHAEGNVPAFVLGVLYKRAGAYYLAKGAYDPVAARALTDSFSGVDDQNAGCGKTVVYRKNFNFLIDFGINPASDTILMLRLRPVYNNAKFYFDPNGTVLPLQGKRIESVGTAGSGVTRKIVVYQQYKSPGSIFDNVLYSQTDLTK